MLTRIDVSPQEFAREQIYDLPAGRSDLQFFMVGADNIELTGGGVYKIDIIDTKSQSATSYKVGYPNIPNN